MKELIWEQWWLFLGIGICFLGSVYCQLLIAYHMKKMIRESENLEFGEIKFLKEWIE